jgi:CBS domain-containing protein
MLRLRDIMSTDVLTAPPDMNIRDAMALLATRHVSGVPVVTGTRLVGVVSATDLLSFASSLPGVPTERSEQSELDELEPEDVGVDDEEIASVYFGDFWSDAGADAAVRFDAILGPEWNVLEEHTVSEAMTRTPVCMGPEDSVIAAAEAMCDASIHRVLVTEHGVLLGIVTASDIVRSVADQRLTSRTFVFRPEREFDSRGWLSRPTSRADQ